MAIRVTRVGDAWPNHLERNLIEYWKIDDSAAGAVTAGATIALPKVFGRVPIGVIGSAYSINTSTNVITLSAPAIAAANAALIMVIFEPGPT